MRILFIALLLLTLVGCAHSNLAWHWPALYYYDSRTLADQNFQYYLSEQNRQQNSPQWIDAGINAAYTPLDW